MTSCFHMRPRTQSCYTLNLFSRYTLDAEDKIKDASKDWIGGKRTSLTQGDCQRAHLGGTGTTTSSAVGILAIRWKSQVDEGSWVNECWERWLYIRGSQHVKGSRADMLENNQANFMLFWLGHHLTSLSCHESHPPPYLPTFFFLFVLRQGFTM